MSVKISIIIPVYNVEKYLRECLDSAINQTFKDIEIICINDGSTDSSSDILKEYEQKDNRLKVISQTNKGVSTARNVGIQNANGEYIMFVDSDDWLAKEACEKAYCTAQKSDCEMLLFSHNKFNNQSCTSDSKLQDLYIELQDKCTTFEKSLEHIVFSPCEPWGKLYKTEFLKKNNLRFRTNIQFGEDRIFYFQACIYAKSISVLYEHLYYYRQNTENSLTKNNTTVFLHLFKTYLAVNKILRSANLKNHNEACVRCLNWTIQVYLWQWYGIHNSFVQAKNIKYLYKIAKECKKVSKEDKEYLTEYDRLRHAIYDFRRLYWKKLFEPIFEMEKRRNRIVVYLFEKQAFNVSTNKIIDLILCFRYFKHLFKLRIIAKYRKIRVGFWVTEIQKWSSNASLFHALLDSKYFEPYVLLANFKKTEIGISAQEHIAKGTEFFKKNNINFKVVYDTKTKKHRYLNEFKPDIVFYQQPWQIPEIQSLIETSKTALIAYVPYCYYSFNSYMNYLLGFHGKLWKYFVESNLHKKEYEQKFNAKNCIAIGSCKLDSYKNLDMSKINQIWKTTDKKRIIYAPHLSFEQENVDYATATFDKNGDFILELAKSHPETEWIFRPHPVFRDRVLRYKIRTLEEIENYYSEWKKVGSIYAGGDYYEMFAGSDCLITDCISFLSEYLPSGKPVIHLRKDNKKGSFNNLLKTITDDYYKVYDNETLLKVFNEVIVNSNDYLKDKRIENIKLLMIDENKTTGEKIKEYLEKELWLRK